MSARRSLLTASAAGTLLGALWFVPSANATDDTPAEYRTQTTTTTVLRAAAHTDAGPSTRTAPGTTRSARQAGLTASAGAADSSGTADSAAAADASGTAGSPSAGTHTRLADTGSFDTTPYVAGGTLFLSLGAGFVVYSVRRERATAY